MFKFLFNWKYATERQNGEVKLGGNLFLNSLSNDLDLVLDVLYWWEVWTDQEVFSSGGDGKIFSFENSTVPKHLLIVQFVFTITGLICWLVVVADVVIMRPLLRIVGVIAVFFSLLTRICVMPILLIVRGLFNAYRCCRIIAPMILRSWCCCEKWDDLTHALKCPPLSVWCEGLFDSLEDAYNEQRDWYNDFVKQPLSSGYLQFFAVVFEDVPQIFITFFIKNYDASPSQFAILNLMTSAYNFLIKFATVFDDRDDLFVVHKRLLDEIKVRRCRITCGASFSDGRTFVVGGATKTLLCRLNENVKIEKVDEINHGANSICVLGSKYFLSLGEIHDRSSTLKPWKRSFFFHERSSSLKLWEKSKSGLKDASKKFPKELQKNCKISEIAQLGGSRNAFVCARNNYKDLEIWSFESGQGVPFTSQKLPQITVSGYIKSMSSSFDGKKIVALANDTLLLWKESALNVWEQSPSLTLEYEILVMSAVLFGDDKVVVGGFGGKLNVWDATKSWDVDDSPLASVDVHALYDCRSVDKLLPIKDKPMFLSIDWGQEMHSWKFDNSTNQVQCLQKFNVNNGDGKLLCILNAEKFLSSSAGRITTAKIHLWNMKEDGREATPEDSSDESSEELSC